MVVSLSAKALALSASVLYLKFATTVAIQGGKTFAAGHRPPEDVKLSVAKHFPGVKQVYGAVETEKEADDMRLVRAREAEYRWKRIVQNDVESIPLGLIVFGTGVLVEANERVLIAAIATFTLVRLVHTYVYAHEMQPARGYMWTVGVLSIVVGIVNTIITGVLAN